MLRSSGKTFSMLWVRGRTAEIAPHLLSFSLCARRALCPFDDLLHWMRSSCWNAPMGLSPRSDHLYGPNTRERVAGMACYCLDLRLFSRPAIMHSSCKFHRDMHCLAEWQAQTWAMERGIFASMLANCSGVKMRRSNLMKPCTTCSSQLVEATVS